MSERAHGYLWTQQVNTIDRQKGTSWDLWRLSTEVIHQLRWSLMNMSPRTWGSCCYWESISALEGFGLQGGISGNMVMVSLNKPLSSPSLALKQKMRKTYFKWQTHIPLHKCNFYFYCLSWYRSTFGKDAMIGGKSISDCEKQVSLVSCSLEWNPQSLL